MDRQNLIECCRSGDLDGLKYLVEVKEVEVNIRDVWDSTPLYYACLCGHKEIVKYLLSCGAKCEAKTFDGERCLYGSLTDEIRDILKSFKAVTTGHARKNIFYEFLKKLLESGQSADITFTIQYQSFPVHRCILHARSAYFAEMLETKWASKGVIHIKSTMVRPDAFRAILQYIYTDRLEIHLDLVDDCLRFAKQCQMTGLTEKLNERLKMIENFGMNKPGTEITLLSIEPTEDDTCLQDDLHQLAVAAIPNELKFYHGFVNLPFFNPYVPPSFADICFSVGEHQFYCQKIFFSGRSDYFKALITDHFCESSLNPNSTPVLTLHDVSAELFSQIVYYIYSDKLEEDLSSEMSYDLLCVADLYLLPGLKRICANQIAKNLTENNVVNVLRVARMFSLTKLEDQCAEFMACILDRILETEDFIVLVKEDAESVKGRQAIDSIMIVDDIRFHINNIQAISGVHEAQEKLAALDRFLSSLDIEC